MTSVAQQQEDLNTTLFEALIADGFTRCRCGPNKDDPTALIVFYEWPDHLDMITVPRDGPSAAARLVKPSGVAAVDNNPKPFVLNPPPTALWAWVGPVDQAIWALLELPHPDCPDAPAQEIPTPKALRVPREDQRPMVIRVPDKGKRSARAVRLSQPRPPRVMSEQFFNDLLDEVDRESAIGFALNFTEDGVFRWGNFEPVEGRTAITEFTQGFFSMVSAVRHQIDNYWLVTGQLAVTDGRVTFFPLDGEEVTVPFATRARFTLDGTLMTAYQVYLDPSPLLHPQR